MSRSKGTFTRYITNYVVNHLPSFRLRHAWYRRALGWQIAPGAAILLNQQVHKEGIYGRQKVTIGQNAVINQGCVFYPAGEIVIEENVSISSGTALITTVPDPQAGEIRESYQPIVVRHHAWICMRATIMGGVTIGEGAVVMTGAVVVEDVPPYTIVGGIPAKVTGERKLNPANYELAFQPLFE